MKTTSYVNLVLAFLIIALSASVYAGCTTYCSEMCCYGVTWVCYGDWYPPGSTMCGCSQYCDYEACCPWASYVICDEDAKYISQNVPTRMFAGKGYDLSLTMKNNGSVVWTYAGKFKLGSQSPQDNTRWGTNRVSLASGESVAINAQKKFEFGTTAPSTPGNYSFQWRMIHEGVRWFGDYSPLTIIEVICPKNEIGLIAPPEVFDPKTKTVVVTWEINNTGESDLALNMSSSCGGWPCFFTDYTQGAKITLPMGETRDVSLNVSLSAVDLTKEIGIYITYDDADSLPCSASSVAYSAVNMTIPHIT